MCIRDRPCSHRELGKDVSGYIKCYSVSSSRQLPLLMVIVLSITVDFIKYYCINNVSVKAISGRRHRKSDKENLQGGTKRRGKILKKKIIVKRIREKNRETLHI